MSKGTIFLCQNCNKETIKTTNGPQKYCPNCSQIMDMKRKGKWAKDNPKKFTKEELKQRTEKQKSTGIQRGKVINEKERLSIAWTTEIDDVINTLIRISVPFEYGISKNAAWSMVGNGHVFLKKNHRKIRDAIALRIKTASKDITWFEDKVWIDIFVQKPNHKGDAINVVDAVCDAVKEAIGVDDRWFSIRKLDWQITKENPRLFVGVGQNSDSHKRICSYCGRILELDNFWKDKNDRLGVGRECKTCVTKKRSKK